jgi:hypothetical protein
MSWNAYACRLKPDPYYRSPDETMLVPLEGTDELLPTFQTASDQVEKQGAGVEMSLACGCLASRTSARAIEQATGEVPFGEWPSEKVQKHAALANWSFSVPENDLGCKLSAEAFLNVCAEHKLAIRFD